MSQEHTMTYSDQYVGVRRGIVVPYLVNSTYYPVIFVAIDLQLNQALPSLFDGVRGGEAIPPFFSSIFPASAPSVTHEKTFHSQLSCKLFP